MHLGPGTKAPSPGLGHPAVAQVSPTPRFIRTARVAAGADRTRLRGPPRHEVPTEALQGQAQNTGGLMPCCSGGSGNLVGGCWAIQTAFHSTDPRPSALHNPVSLPGRPRSSRND